MSTDMYCKRTEKLKKNNFISNGDNFTQINGTTMSTNMTLSCSHMALGYFFTQDISAYDFL
jgi:hypothetical protein